jgi:hypothetical protein
MEDNAMKSRSIVLDLLIILLILGFLEQLGIKLLLERHCMFDLILGNFLPLLHHAIIAFLELELQLLFDLSHGRQYLRVALDVLLDLLETVELAVEFVEVDGFVEVVEVYGLLLLARADLVGLVGDFCHVLCISI